MCKACFSNEHMAKHSRMGEYREQFVKDLDPSSPGWPATLGDLSGRLKTWRATLQSTVEDSMPPYLRLEDEARNLQVPCTSHSLFCHVVLTLAIRYDYTLVSITLYQARCAGEAADAVRGSMGGGVQGPWRLAKVGGQAVVLDPEAAVRSSMRLQRSLVGQGTATCSGLFRVLSIADVVFQEQSFTDVEMPGQYLGTAEVSPDSVVYLERFGANVGIVRRHATSYRRLALNGSDGKTVNFLVQTGQHWSTPCGMHSKPWLTLPLRLLTACHKCWQDLTHLANIHCQNLKAVCLCNG